VRFCVQKGRIRFAALRSSRLHNVHYISKSEASLLKLTEWILVSGLRILFDVVRRMLFHEPGRADMWLPVYL
jgi:hypothetical protein